MSDQQNQLPSRKVRKEMQRKSHISIIKVLLICIIILSILFMFFGCTSILEISNWGKFDPNKLVGLKQTSLIYDANNNLVTGVHGLENRINVPLSDVPLFVQNAFIAIEDVRFYEHNGIDYKRIVGAILTDIREKGFIEGASTISQQLIRNTYLSKEKTISRKLKEVYLAYQLEKKYTKEQILNMYLNLIYFGDGAYGIEAASKSYFGKSVSKLTIAEGALLAGIPKSPTKYSPKINLDESINRRNVVLDSMKKYTFISEEEAATGKKEKVNLIDENHNLYPYGFYIDTVIKEAVKILNIKEEEIFTGGYKIYTSLDQNLQSFCESIFENDNYFPSPMSGEKIEASVTILNPNDAGIKCIIGGRSYTIKRGYNRATSLIRQPGSAIKPILVYAPAIEQNLYMPSSSILDEQTHFNNYTPSNSGDKYNGWITLRYALAKSINIPAVKVLNDVGVENAKLFASKMGIQFDSHDTSLALALGGFHIGISPLTLGNAYIPFVHDGMYATASTIRNIENKDGIKVYNRTPQWNKVMSKETAFLVTNMLQSAVEWGTGNKANITGLPIAGKTGTVEYHTNDAIGNKDAWMVAFNPEQVISVWMGFDQTDKNHFLTSNITGGTYPAVMIADIFKEIYKQSKGPNFIKPSGIEEVKLDAKTLWEKHEIVLANSLTPEKYITKEYFSKSNVPTKETNYWVIPQPPDDLSIVLGPNRNPILSFTPKNSFAEYKIIRQKSNEIPELIAQSVHNGTGKKYMNDLTAQPEIEYEYYIIPVHPEIIMNDKPLEGPASNKVTFKFK